MGFFSPLHPSLISLWVSSAVSAVSTQKRNSVKALCSPGVFFLPPNSLLPSPPFPLMNWHAGRNICHYSHFLTACAAWIGSCSGRKQLSGKSGEIKERDKPPGFFCKGSKTSSYCSLNSELRVKTITAWQLTQTLEIAFHWKSSLVLGFVLSNTQEDVTQNKSDFDIILHQRVVAVTPLILCRLNRPLCSDSSTSAWQQQQLESSWQCVHWICIDTFDIWPINNHVFTMLMRK